MNYQDVLDFWFKNNTDKWFVKSEEFDSEIRRRFQNLYEDIKSGKKKVWENSPHSLLASVIVLDQFPRNMFRGTKKSFETDLAALRLTKKALLEGFDKKLNSLEKVFLYLPLEHSEELSDQEDAVKLFTQLHEETQNSALFLDYAIQHYKIIKRFGRFPHRNQILERTSTPEEVEFLKEKGSSF
jgi:uncharacterized protein (DUF924 family)